MGDSKLRADIRSWTTDDDNWDGYGATATTAEARRKAWDVAPYIEQFDPDMQAFPTTSGGVEFESDENLLTVLPDGTAVWADLLIRLMQKGRSQ